MGTKAKEHRRLDRLAYAPIVNWLLLVAKRTRIMDVNRLGSGVIHEAR